MSIPENNSVMLKDLAGSRLGIWVAHGEGKYNIDDQAQVMSIFLNVSEDYKCLCVLCYMYDYWALNTGEEAHHMGTLVPYG